MVSGTKYTCFLMCEPVTVTIGLTFSFWCGVHILRIRASCTNNIDSAGGRRRLARERLKVEMQRATHFGRILGKEMEEWEETQRQLNDLSILSVSQLVRRYKNDTMKLSED